VRGPGERAFDLAVALSAFSWAVLGLANAPPADRTSAVRLCITVLHVAVGFLALRRRPLGRLGSPGQLAASLPALMVSGLALGNAHPPSAWPALAQLVFAGGTALALGSFVQLGTSFAVLPALREIRTGGPYRLVRHPAYLGELLMIAACALASPWRAAWPAALALPLVMLRVRAEEGLLERSFAWCTYRERVRWRLFPWLW
jgi:protein-S-isoprenylcysteine O-methyltransferase Ste14